MLAYTLRTRCAQRKIPPRTEGFFFDTKLFALLSSLALRCLALRCLLRGLTLFCHGGLRIMSEG